MTATSWNCGGRTWNQVRPRTLVRKEVHTSLLSGAYVSEPTRVVGSRGMDATVTVVLDEAVG